MENCIICKQPVSDYDAVKTPHGTVHSGPCLSYYNDASKTTNLNESDLGKELEKVQIL
ncbi:hypothetical protein ZPAH1_orf00248 [Aeromonas phage ZPAH1]|nr:hypothetical protein ASwh1_199 [Aeromonas phage Aswh_1]QQG34010.1 hypothetical protein ZPAH1_orf00248 [Aeromonas phage ZPAH1]